MPATDKYGGPRLPIFIYGTLLKPRVLARYSGDALLHRRGIPALAPGYQRVALRGTPYPTLRRGPGEVRGLLIRPTPRALGRLADYEGRFYRLMPLRVVTPRGPRHARAWLADAWRADQRHWA
ncbi:AIG2-like family protein [Acetobacteraceae bacterium AT-5844]|nr:AIG2-like family protein [Acetobacteraceae bacterium AT-5844]